MYLKNIVKKLALILLFFLVNKSNLKKGSVDFETIQIHIKAAYWK